MKQAGPISSGNFLSFLSFPISTTLARPTMFTTTRVFICASSTTWTFDWSSLVVSSSRTREWTAWAYTVSFTSDLPVSSSIEHPAYVLVATWLSRDSTLLVDRTIQYKCFVLFPVVCMILQQGISGWYGSSDHPLCKGSFPTLPWLSCVVALYRDYDKDWLDDDVDEEAGMRQGR